QNVALAVKQLGLRYVVVTSVARDDIEDEGALQFAKTIWAIRRLTPEVKIEVLVPDFSAKEGSLKILSDAAPEVISHNIETVRRLAPVIRPQILTIGQYLAPSRAKRHLPVERFISPEEFEDYRQKGLEMGFVYVESGPLV